jgi:hypothetical protein
MASSSAENTGASILRNNSDIYMAIALIGILA